MHILVINDDGPPSNQSSPYVHSLVDTLQSAGHTASVILPHVQRSWIGKAHMVGQTLTPTYFRPGALHEDDGITATRPFDDGKEEWILIDGTPASCTQIGLYHFFKDRGPIDLVLSGPNYGRNTTAIFSLSSGTLGGAMEGAICGKKSIALSYAFDSRDHNPEWIAAASRLSVRLVEKLVNEWPEDVHVYSINVPLREGVASAKIIYAEMLQNQWKRGSSFQELTEDESDGDPNEEERNIREGSEANGHAKRQVGKRTRVKYKWAPNFADVRETINDASHGDGWEILQGNVSVTPLKANFWHLPDYKGEIKLTNDSGEVGLAEQSPTHTPGYYAVIDYPDPYVQPLLIRASRALLDLPCEIIGSISQLPNPSAPVLQITAYEAIDFDHAVNHTTTSLVCAYVIRKALIRKHYLSNTVSTWLVKHPDSVLRYHVPRSVHFELDYAEFLDEALVDAWDLTESLKRNEGNMDNKEWWILKPGMSDGGNGIRLFSSKDELNSIFEEWEPEDDDDEVDDDVVNDSENDEHSQQYTTHTGVEQTSGNGVSSQSRVEQGNQMDKLQLTVAKGPERDDESLPAAMTSQLRHFIAQPYILSPLLLKSMSERKFHIRTYVLAAGSLRVYVYREMLALFSAKSYEPPSVADEVPDMAQHLTNTCFQDELTREGSVHRFWKLYEEGLSSSWQEDVFAQICEVTGEVFEAAAREQLVHFQTLPNAFEIFGVDFLVDDNLTVWLLELNAYPDFKQTGQELQDTVVGGLFEEVFKVAIEPTFTQRPVHVGTERLRLVRSLDLGRR